MKNILVLLAGLFFFCCRCSAQAAGEKMIYVVDSIPQVGEVDEADADMDPSDISEMIVIKNKDSLKRLGYGNMDGAIYIFTKGYRSRSDEERKIPSARTMMNKGGQVYLKGKTEAYSGPFINYYLCGHKQAEGMIKDGKVSGRLVQYYRTGNTGSEQEYENGVLNGMEKRYYENGVLEQKGVLKNGKEEGVWERYYPNGQVEQHSIFLNGVMTEESINYYSNGRIKSRESVKNGKATPDESHAQVYKYFEKGSSAAKEGDYASAIKQYSKCIQIDSLYASAWFGRGTAELEDLQFDKALSDLDEALLLEPYFREALGNRAFCRIRKYQFAGSRIISKNRDVTVLGSKDVPSMPEEEKAKVCADLQKALLLHESKKEIRDAVKDYCPLKN